MHTLFLIEDHPVMRKMLRRLLESEPDLTVIGEADSAENAIASLESLTPDLVLVDLSLPGMSGLSLIKWLKAKRPELRCLVVTGHTDPLYESSALLVGAVGYVTKDDPDAVLDAVMTVLDAA